MKKLLLTAALLFASLGAFAAEKEEPEELRLFDRFVSELKKKAPEDADVRGDREHRFVYLDLQMPVASTAPFDISAAREGVAMYLKGAAELFKTLKITVLVNFVTTDRKIRTVVVTPQELQAAARSGE